MILRRRGQLLSWLEQNAPTASIRRAVGAGSVEFLGWFEEIPGSKFPGWIIQATCPITNKVWSVVVRKRLDQLYYHVWVFDHHSLIPWKHWNPENSKNPFFYGDNPEEYTQYRENVEA